MARPSSSLILQPWGITAPDSSPDRTRSIPDTPLAPSEIVRSLARRPQVWRSRIRFRQPRFHVRVAAEPGWEAWLLTWLPGQSTGLRDHGGSAGAFTVLAESVDEDVPARHLGHGPRRPHLVTRCFGAGQVRAFGPEHVHDVVARNRRPAVTLHVYAPRLTAMTRYDLVDGEISVTSREREGRDW